MPRQSLVSVLGGFRIPPLALSWATYNSREVSSGANVWAARQLAQRLTGNIATVLPDRAERYFSTALM